MRRRRGIVQQLLHYSTWPRRLYRDIGHSVFGPRHCRVDDCTHETQRQNLNPLGFWQAVECWGFPSQCLLLRWWPSSAQSRLPRPPMGRSIYAVGLNPAPAHLAGVRVQRVRVGVYVVSGVLAALGGILLTSRLSSVHPALGTGYELTAIAAAAVGGTSLAGGTRISIGDGSRSPVARRSAEQP